ncbi:RB1CC1 [Lepeophtheirus salmonis]|uniref:RB1CC1 n=1 Tax=Lepeophtheirus salmonis TaxID=72036 RepID=A0A7R8CWC5_LEPSM|nr:RB1CC1 [Lepeophtheirus salmonis]CAF2950972.1 RB1CC1 [Lepeophtheirus salmonis]
MLQLDMNLAVETVGSLKGVLEAQTQIPVEKQILLISGGESCDEEQKVCKYTAGTDTNPIFLFSMSSIEEGGGGCPPLMPSNPNQDMNSDRLKNKVESALSLPDASSTVAIRATIAQEFVEASREQSRLCETLIHDQHLQHQGWSAVVANLEDTASDLHKRYEKFQNAYKQYLKDRNHYKALVDEFDDDITLLDQIPVFPSLLRASSDKSMVGSIIPGEPYDHDRSVSLLEWISERGSNQLDEEQMNKIITNAQGAIEGSKNTSMKEIRGVGDRLSQLEQLLHEAKKVVQEQSDLANAFVQNQQRASNLKDSSILPNLCDSHRQQLIVMSKNYESVVSIRKRCANAKGELSVNLHSRLKWIVFIQNKIAEAAQSIVINFESLRRLGKKLEVMEQLHLAPSMFMTTAVEVVRRKAFSLEFSKQACELSTKFEKVYNEEINLREEFQSKLKKHFICRMFPGLEDNPPSFATKKPKPFDEKLPDITLNDIEELRRKLPELASYLQLPEEKALDHLLNRSYNDGFTEQDGLTRNSLQTMAQRLPSRNSHELMAMSVMNPLSFDNKKIPSHVLIHSRPSSKVNLDNSDTDDTNEDIGKNHLKKLTLSLPSEQNKAINNKPQKHTAISDSSGVDPNSSSSAPPSSSSEGGASLCFKTGASSISSSTPIHPISKLRSELNELKYDVKGFIHKFQTEAMHGLKRELSLYVTSAFGPMSENVTRLKSELLYLNEKGGNELENLRIEKEEQLRESVRKMTLEHELEMDNLKVELNKIQNADNYQQDISNLSKTERDSLLAEKDKIVSILEAGFIQREKLSIKTREEELKKDYQEELERTRKEIYVDLQKDFSDREKHKLDHLETSQKLIDAKKEEEFTLRISQEREKWKNEKVKEIQAEVDKTNMMAKKEIDVLRSRFKIMQASGALERSPSASESELSLESPRPELLEQIRSVMAKEYDNNLKAERNRWEQRLRQISAEHKSQLDDLKAEKQVNFNEVLNSVVEKKDRAIDKLTQEIEELKSRKLKSDDEKRDLETKIEDLGCQNEKLESEINYNQRIGEDCSEDEDLTSLQMENTRLKELLSKRMSDNYSCGKISVTSTDIGDCVMIVWSQETQQYIIYNEKGYYAFLHTDSIQSLGLSEEKRFTTGIVVDGRILRHSKIE